MHHVAGASCLRSPVCAHCANAALQLTKPGGQRFMDAKPPGAARCIICRETCVDASRLTPDLAYCVLSALMDVMDVLRLGGSCR